MCSPALEKIYKAPMPAQIPRDQYAVYVKDFNAFDENENGALEEAEIIAMIKHQTKDASIPEKFSLQEVLEQVKGLAAEFDKNGDGKIDLEEYITKVVGGEWEIAECANGDETKMKKLLAKIKKDDLQGLKSLSAPPTGVQDACNALHILVEGKSAECPHSSNFRNGWKGMTISSCPHSHSQRHVALCSIL